MRTKHNKRFAIAFSGRSLDRVVDELTHETNLTMAIMLPFGLCEENDALDRP